MPFKQDIFLNNDVEDKEKGELMKTLGIPG